MQYIAELEASVQKAGKFKAAPLPNQQLKFKVNGIGSSYMTSLELLADCELFPLQVTYETGRRLQSVAPVLKTSKRGAVYQVNT